MTSATDSGSSNSSATSDTSLANRTTHSPTHSPARIIWSIIGMLCLIGFIALAVSVHKYHILPMDTAVYGFIAAHFISPSLTPVVLIVTKLASAVTLITLAVVLLGVMLLCRQPRMGIAIALNLAVIAACNEILKNIMQRPRPSVLRLAVEHGYSFPSGHAMASTAFYGFLIYLMYRYFHNAAAKWVLIVVLALLIPTIMFTRVYLGVHYCSDVLAGFLLSIAYLTLVWIPFSNRYFLPPVHQN